jgi:2-oxoglutarate ferredoxin oxidoreductase subunit gamma
MVGEWTVRFGGFGGQGIVLSSVVLGLAAVYDGMYVSQRASYGSEARGGKCRSEVIISKEEIAYPLIDNLQILVVMSQQAFESYVYELDPDGFLFYDPDMVNIGNHRENQTIIQVPATKNADKLGNRIIANMIMLGALQSKTKIVSKDSIEKSVRNSVPPKFIELDLRALRVGFEISKFSQLE